jgi:hypothetical protein
MADNERAEDGSVMDRKLIKTHKLSQHRKSSPKQKALRKKRVNVVSDEQASASLPSRERIAQVLR